MDYLIMIKKETEVETEKYGEFVVSEIGRIYKIFNKNSEITQTVIEIMLITILRANGCGKMVINVKDGEFLNYINENIDNGSD